MATMAVPMGYASEIQFQDVEDAVDFVRAGVRFTSRASAVVRLFYKAALFNSVLSTLIDKQAELIEKLNGPAIHNVPVSVLANVAAKTEHLVGLLDQLLYVAYPGRFEPWNEKLMKVADQRDTLQSLAESFRAACDPEHQELLLATLETVYA